MARKKKPKYQLDIDMPVNSNGRTLAANVRVLDEGGNVRASDKANLDSAANRVKVGRSLARQLKDDDPQKWIDAVDEQYNNLLLEQQRAAAAAAAAGSPSSVPANSRPSFAAEDEGDGDSDAPRPQNTDLGNSLRLIAAHGPDLRHVGKWGRWIVWNGCRWEIDDSAAAARRAEQTVVDMLAAAKRAIRAIQQQNPSEN